MHQPVELPARDLQKLTDPVRADQPGNGLARRLGVLVDLELSVRVVMRRSRQGAQRHGGVLNVELPAGSQSLPPGDSRRAISNTTAHDRVRPAIVRQGRAGRAA